MARPPSTAGGRPHGVKVRFSDTELAALDAARGGMSRVDYLRSFVTNVERHMTPPRKIEDTPLPGDTVTSNDRHFCRFHRDEHVGWAKGQKVYRYICECGRTKEDT